MAGLFKRIKETAEEVEAPKTAKQMLRFEVGTNQLDENEAHVHEVPLGTPYYFIIDSIQTLYEHEGINSLYIYIVDAEEE